MRTPSLRMPGRIFAPLGEKAIERMSWVETARLLSIATTTSYPESDARAGGRGLRSQMDAA